MIDEEPRKSIPTETYWDGYYLGLKHKKINQWSYDWACDNVTTRFSFEVNREDFLKGYVNAR